jgi:23S rRNA U2552 (ribose-2'-O)-methylase RlmE/FtsJ
MTKPNALERYFRANTGNRIHKWMHYFDIYDRHFSPFRGKKITVLEFGVQHGGSLQMWRKYFGKSARIIGVDIDPRCLEARRPGIEVFIGDQEDREFLRTLRERIGTVDVLIEDGGHTMPQQINTFEEFWPAISDGGVFLIEDLHTSYWKRFGGGYLNPASFIEYAKRLIDQQNAWHAEPDSVLVVDDYTRSIRGMHTYDSIIVFDKAVVEKPHHEQKGTKLFDDGSI